VVEAQHVISTRKLVDTTAEQEELERIIDDQKPALAQDFIGLNYLLFTPFRYPPLRNGSRFGTRQQRGIWYGSDAQRTAFAEVAYYKLLFLEGSTAKLDALELKVSAFQANVATDAGIDLTLAPFWEYRGRISSPVAYDEAQALGNAMREAGVAVFRYASARDREGTNIGLFSPAFARKDPDTPESWFCHVSRGGVEYRPANIPRRESHVFPREQFLVDGGLPAPAL
jgi:hypothetical protein